MNCKNCGMPTLRQGFCCDECEAAYSYHRFELGQRVYAFLWVAAGLLAVVAFLYFLKRIGAI